VNAAVGPYTVDFLWRESRVVVETDGWQAHRGRQAFEDDRARDLFLRSKGIEALRFSWRQVIDDPASVADVLRRYLARAA
jgi:very-short-patch-repair endonuclease